MRGVINFLMVSSLPRPFLFHLICEVALYILGYLNNYSWGPNSRTISTKLGLPITLIGTVQLPQLFEKPRLFYFDSGGISLEPVIL
jgi:hypothetical protein